MKMRILSKSLFLVFVLLLTAICFVQINLDQNPEGRSRAKSLSLLPKGELLKTVSLGYSSVIADLLWLEVVQAIGEKEATEAGYQWIYNAADVVTTLDPKFEYSYEIAGIALSALGKQYELSNQILMKGLRNSPNDWKMPFYLGFNYFFYLNDYQNAAKYISLSATLPGHSAYLPGLAARLYVEAKDPDLALEVLNNIYQDAKDENVKQQIEIRIREVIIERDILELNRGIEKYRERFNVSPGNLKELVDRQIVQVLPEEPFGGRYFIEEKTGFAQSSTHPERLKVYRK